jgi:hypothetical protein
MVSSVSAMLPVIVSASLLLIFYCIYRLNTEVLDLRAGLQRAVEQIVTSSPPLVVVPPPPQANPPDADIMMPKAPIQLGSKVQLVEEPSDGESADQM